MDNTKELFSEYELSGDGSGDKVISELDIVDVSFGYYDDPHDFNIYFTPRDINSEHGVVLLCDKIGQPLRAHVE